MCSSLSLLFLFPVNWPCPCNIMIMYNIIFSCTTLTSCVTLMNRVWGTTKAQWSWNYCMLVQWHNYKSSESAIMELLYVSIQTDSPGEKSTRSEHPQPITHPSNLYLSVVTLSSLSWFCIYIPSCYLSLRRLPFLEPFHLLQWCTHSYMQYHSVANVLPYYVWLNIL